MIKLDGRGYRDPTMPSVELIAVAKTAAIDWAVPIDQMLLNSRKALIIVTGMLFDKGHKSRPSQEPEPC